MNSLSNDIKVKYSSTKIKIGRIYTRMVKYCKYSHRENRM